MSNIMLFREITSGDVGKVGVKGANLAALSPHFKVPPGFVITSEAYEAFLASSDIEKKIQTLLSSVTNKNLQETANKIQKLIVETEMPKDLTNDILEAYNALSFKGKPSAEDLIKEKADANVAVRGSYTKEHSQKELSQFTFLNVKGEKRLITAIKVVFAAQFTSNNIRARKDHGISHNAKTAVVVQKMIDAEKSVLGFSFNPNNKNHYEIYIKAIFGLGEGFSHGDTAFDAYVMDKQNLTIKESIVAEQSSKHVLDFDTKKTSKVLLKEQGKKQKLDDREIREAARLTKKISALFDSEQRVEFGIMGTEFFVFQSKKIGEKIKIAPLPEGTIIEKVEPTGAQEEPPKVEIYTDTLEDDNAPITKEEETPDITIKESKSVDDTFEFLQKLEEEADKYQEPLKKEDEPSDEEETSEEEHYNQTQDLKTEFEKEEKPKEPPKKDFFNEEKEEDNSDFKFEEEEDDSIFSSVKEK